MDTILECKTIVEIECKPIVEIECPVCKNVTAYNILPDIILRLYFQKDKKGRLIGDKETVVIRSIRLAAR